MAGLKSVMAAIEAQANGRRDAMINRLRDRAALIAADAKGRVLRNRQAGRGRPSELADSIATVDEAGGARVEATADHAKFVEFGTVRMPAEPFLGPSFDDHTADLATDTKPNKRNR